MSQPVSIPLSVNGEFQAAGAALAALYGDIVAKKSISQIIADTLPAALSATAAVGDFAGDISRVDNQVYLLRCILLSMPGAKN